MQNLDIVRFVDAVFVGEILEFKAQVIQVDLKSNKVHVRVVCETISPIDGKTLTDEQSANTFQLTYSVKDIKLKQVLPKTYKQSLLFLQGMRVL